MTKLLKKEGVYALVCGTEEDGAHTVPPPHPWLKGRGEGRGGGGVKAKPCLFRHLLVVPDSLERQVGRGGERTRERGRWSSVHRDTSVCAAPV
jgi:hypothetical protein